MVGTWQGNNFVKGKWVLPNGTFFEGEFVKNQPNGKGKWVFQDGNNATGDYTQTEEEKDTPEGDKKMVIKLTWKTAGDLIEAASKVNTCEALNY